MSTPWKTALKLLALAGVGVGVVLVYRRVTRGDGQSLLVDRAPPALERDPWTTPILFASGSLGVSSSYNDVLSSAARHLLANPRDVVEITGHTDSVGSVDRNYEIGWDRAESVGAHLENAGVAIQQIDVTSLGPDEPAASNATESGRAQNRRVTMRLQRGAR